jgi:hypothetical protein
MQAPSGCVKNSPSLSHVHNQTLHRDSQSQEPLSHFFATENVHINRPSCDFLFLLFGLSANECPVFFSDIIIYRSRTRTVKAIGSILFWP